MKQINFRFTRSNSSVVVILGSHPRDPGSRSRQPNFLLCFSYFCTADLNQFVIAVPLYSFTYWWSNNSRVFIYWRKYWIHWWSKNSRIFIYWWSTAHKHKLMASWCTKIKHLDSGILLYLDLLNPSTAVLYIHEQPILQWTIPSMDPRTPSQISEGWPVVCLNLIKTPFFFKNTT